MRAAKFGLAAVVAGLTALSAAINDGRVDNGEWWFILLSALAAVGVYYVPNIPDPGRR